MVDHHDSYTQNLVHLLALVTGRLPDVVQHDTTTAGALLAAGYTHLVLSPGPGSVADRRDFSIGRGLLAAAEVPVLGVCLGMQGLVSVFGGEVGPVEPAHGELAVVRHTGSGVFAGVPSPFRAVRYHSLAALRLPAVLAPTAWCDGPDGPVLMGVEHRSKPLWGVQFHPESILSEHGAQLVANFVAR